MGKVETCLCGVEQIYIFFKILVETVEKVETYLNWVEQNRTLFFSRVEKVKTYHYLLEKVKTYRNLAETVEIYPFLMGKFETHLCGVEQSRTLFTLAEKVERNIPIFGRESQNKNRAPRNGIFGLQT